MNFRSLRKGCMHCGNPLTTTKERFTRTCDDCARSALQGFQKMSEGKLKEGLNDVLDVSAVSGIKESIVRDRIERATIKRRKTLEKALRKKGLSEEEIQQGIEDFQNAVKEEQKV